MEHPLKTRQQFSCGTISTTFLLEDMHHPAQVTNDVIDYFNQRFQMEVASELIPQASELVDGQGGSEYSKVTHEITYTILGTRVTIGVALTVRAAGLEDKLGCIIAKALSRQHRLVNVAHKVITDKAASAKYQAEHPEEFPEEFDQWSTGGIISDLLSGAFGGTVTVMTLGDLLSGPQRS